MGFAWTKVGVATTLGLVLVAVAMFLRTNDPMLLFFVLPIIALVWAILGAARMLFAVVRRES